MKITYIAMFLALLMSNLAVIAKNPLVTSKQSPATNPFNGFKLLSLATSETADESTAYFSGNATTQPSDASASVIAVEASIVPRIEVIDRTPIPTNGDDTRTTRIQTIIDGKLGAKITGTITVSDVAESSTLKSRNGEDLPSFGKYIVTAKTTWLTTPVISQRDKAVIAKINSECDERVAQYKTQILNLPLVEQSNNHRDYATATDYSASNALRDKIDKVNAARAKAIKDVRDATGKGRPKHVVYIATDDQSVMKWTKGQVHNFSGTIQCFDAFVYPHVSAEWAEIPGVKASEELPTFDDENNSGDYIGVEMIIKSVRTGVTIEPATQPPTLPAPSPRP